MLAMVAGPCGQSGSDPPAFARCVDGLGLRSYVIYEPPDRFWFRQAIESGTYLTLAVLLFVGAWWQVRYRNA
jgi:hypothetical protein